MSLVVERLTAAREADFFALLTREECGGCCCVAWWVESWEGWGERTPAENRALREQLFARGEHDGYLGYEDGRPVAWLQAGPRDRLAKLVRDLGLAPDPTVWALSCLYVRGDRRAGGVARALVEGALRDLAARGVQRVEAYPRLGTDDPLELWNGPEALWASLGFEQLTAARPRAVMRLEVTG